MNLTVPAFGFSNSMQRPVNKSPLDTTRLHSGTDFAADDASDRATRIGNFSSYAATNPGAMPGGTGATGLAPTDGAGWSNLMERQQQYLKDLSVQDGKAAPSVRLGAYDGSNLSSAGGGSGPLPTKGRPMASGVTAPAMKGLQDVIGGGGDGRLPQMINDDPEMYKAYENMVFDQMQGAGRQARQTALSPVDQAMQAGDTRIDDMMAGDRQTARDEDYTDTVSKAAAGARGYFGYGKGVADDQEARAEQLADVKGKAATYDDLVRGATARDVAGIGAGVQDRRTQSQAAIAGLNAAQKAQSNEEQFGTVAPGTAQQFSQRLGAMPGGAGAPPPATGAPPEAEIQAAMRARGWSREQAITEWQRRMSRAQ